MKNSQKGLDIKGFIVKITKHKNFIRWIIGGLIFVIIFYLIIFFGIENRIKTSLLLADDSVSLGIGSEKETVAIDEEFDVGVYMGTNGKNVVAVRAIVKYDPAIFKLVSWNTRESIFAVGNTCVYNGKPCEISSHNEGEGLISITLSKPSPGVKTTSGLLASLRFKALVQSDPSADNFRVIFSGMGNYEDSDVVIDDGLGTDFLAEVKNFRMKVVDKNNPENPDPGKSIEPNQPIVVDFETPTLQTRGSERQERTKLEKGEKIYSRDGKLSFKGEVAGLDGGTVKLYRDGKEVESEKINGTSWSIKHKEKKDGTRDYRMKFFDNVGVEVGETSRYDIRTDTKEPKIVDLPTYLVKSRGEMVWWKAKDDNEVDYYRYILSKVGSDKEKKKSIEKAYFHIPLDMEPGMYTFSLKAYDKARNKTEKVIMIRVR